MNHPPVLVGTKAGFRSIGGSAPSMRGAVDHAVRAFGRTWFIADARTVGHLGAAGPEGVVIDAPANCLLVLDDGARILVGAGGAGLFELRGMEVSRVTSFDGAPGRDSWYTPWGGPPDVRSMACGAEGNIYVNVHVGGVVRSTDEGRTWTDTMDIHADVHQVISHASKPGHTYAATARGLAVTTSGGETWDFSHAGLHGTYCRAVALSEESLFVSASLGPGGRQAALYRRERAEDTFRRCTDGLPEWFSANVDTFCLAAEGTFVVAADPGGVVYISSDDGRTWSTAATGLPDIRCVVIG